MNQIIHAYLLVLGDEGIYSVQFHSVNYLLNSWGTFKRSIYQREHGAL